MMKSHRFPRLEFPVASVLLFFLFNASPARGAEGFKQGPETCQSCHSAEYGVWEQTKHFTSFREVHKNPLAKDILAAVGGSPNMKANETCTFCHYTMVQDSAEAAPRAEAGISCESCHGASSGWLPIHNDYGGVDVTKESETPDHRTKRFQDAEAAGWIHSQRPYEIASNCMACHGLAHPGLDGQTLEKMLGAGHPLRPEFELVRYSQGSVRHRFYPPDVSVNAEMTPAELARLFVNGQAAKLVSAADAMSKSKDSVYQEAQKKRADEAKAALSQIKSIPEAAQFVAQPTHAAAKKFSAAVAAKDLTSEVGNLLPDKAAYK